MSTLTAALMAAVTLSFSVPAESVEAPVGTDMATTVQTLGGLAPAEGEFSSPCSPPAPEGVTPAPTTLPGKRVLMGYSVDGKPVYEQLRDDLRIIGCDTNGMPILAEDPPVDPFDHNLCEVLGDWCPFRH